MRIVTRTVYGAAMSTAQYLRLPYTPKESSTLNEKFGIAANELPGEEDLYGVRYFAIGDGGHSAVTGADGKPYISPNNHAATDAACFNHVPFVLREISDDLTVEERKKYGLRKKETHGGREYFAYYLKRLDVENVRINMQKTVATDGSQTTQPFTPTSANLNPQPMSETDLESNVIQSSGEYVAANAVVTIDFNAADAEELRNVARIIYGAEHHAIISEIALVGAVDRTTTGPGPGNQTIQYREAIGTQVVTHITSYYQMNMQNNGFTFTADVGGTEPLFTATEGQ
tara:strand:- start:58971 stop:59828 length:858 start_codon:yes stop_codon:yes gene_type:complete